MLDKYIKWLEIYKPKSLRHYTSGYNTINKICQEHDIMLLEDWDAKNWNKNYDALILVNEFKELNSSGNNILTATLSNYKKLIMEKTSTINIPPVITFPEFKWRWAVTTPSESLNTEELLFGVLSILVKHNGQRHATQEFKNDLLELQDRTGTSIDLAKIDRDINKNIIENSGQYWKALGLLNSTNDGTISVTDLGIGIIKGSISKLDFIKKLYNDFSLPNPNIESTSTISIWNDNKIVIYPFKIIFNILFGISKRNQSPTNWYIESEELKDVVIPLSIYKDLDVNVYIDNILEYRNDKSQFSSWPNCAPGDNDFRMIKEYLLFLSNFGFLDLVELKDKSKRYYINSLTLSVLDETVSLKKEDVIIKKTGTAKSAKVTPINKIYFGAPGTGKSFRITEDLKDVDTIFQKRITFHPEYDNSSFVGGYKPITNNKGDINYEFVPQIFTNIYVEACNDTDHQYYLIIEEINRGNCAEIFGELFQLLDRDEKYKITPSNELIIYLNNNIKDSKFYVNGEMLLPDNLSIYATMNTSDQSLFPMDSAFKRRWDWEYIPICYTDKDEFENDNKSFHYEIDIEDGQKYSWIKFIEKINLNHIKINPSLGMDKCIGNYFIKPDNGNVISLKPFVNKVIFYLWNDVFKDEDYKEVFGENISYEDFFPLVTNGKSNIIKLFDRIKLEPKITSTYHEVEPQLGLVAEPQQVSESE